MIKLGPVLSYNQLVESIGELEIVKRYVPYFQKLNKSFRLRPYKEDTKPSCRVFTYNGNLFIRDFGDSRYPNARSIFQFIQDEYNKDYEQALEMITLDFKNDIPRTLNLSNRSIYKTNQDPSSSVTTIKVKYREWFDYDIEYWGQFGITIKLLESAGVRPISYFWIDSQKVHDRMFKASKLSYSYDYYIKDGVFRRKIYQPLNEYMKWLSNCGLDVVQNYRNLPKSGDLLVIQSSLKDALTMNSFGYESVAPISEAAWFTDEYYAKIKVRFKSIIYFANNDWNKQENSGLLYGERILSEHNIPFVYIEDQYECSDISDFRKKYNSNKTGAYINKLLK